MRSLCVHNFQSKREGSIAERAVKFLACIVDNSYEVYDPLCVVRKLLKESQETTDTYEMGWYHGSTPTDNPLLFFFNAFTLHTLLNL